MSNPATTAADTSRLTAFYGEMSSLDSILGAVDSTDGTIRAQDLYRRNLDCHNLGMFPVVEHLASTVATVDPPQSGDAVLDIGCGLGGPGRFLVDRFGCSVVGVDVLPLRVEIARELTRRTGMGDRVSYRVADATNLPFDDAAFAQAWMLDVAMHVRDKRRLFQEIARLLGPGGLLVMHDQLGPLPPAMRPLKRRAPYLAVPFPRLVRYVEDAGLRIVTWQDTTPAVLDFFVGIRAALGADSEPATRGRDAGNLLTLLDAYHETLANQGGRTGMLIARRGHVGTA